MSVAWVVVHDGKPRHDIAAMMRARQLAYPRGKETARAALVLLQSARRAHERIRTRVQDFSAWGIIGQKMRLLAELSQLSSRLDQYAGILASVAPSDPLPVSARPLFFNVPGQGHPTPDFLTPYVVDNQLAALEADRRHAQSPLELAFAQLKHLATKAKEGGAAVVDVITPSPPTLAIVGVFALAAAGVAAYAYSKGKHPIL